MEEMTPKPTIDVTDDEENGLITAERKKRLIRLLRLTGNDVIELWRAKHLSKIGLPNEFVNYNEYLRAVEDPDPYDETYIFFCMKK